MDHSISGNVASSAWIDLIHEICLLENISKKGVLTPSCSEGTMLNLAIRN